MKDKTAREKTYIYAIMAAGVVLRFVYVIFSTIYDRQYDIGQIDLDAGHTVSGGHLAYIQYIYHNGLPDFDPTTVYQFHHPPLHHWICATWMKLCSLVIKNTDVLEESIQVIPFVCSILILWILYKVVCSFCLTEKTKCLVMSIFAFHPSLILLSGSVNNDCMALLFMVMIVYFTIRWSHSKSWLFIVLLAFSIGPGMLVKQNVAEMAFPVAAVFLYVLIKERMDKKELMRLAGQYAVFGLISIPIGMSFYVRNLVKFNMSMFWVYELPTDSWQYTGNVPLIHRFLWPNPSEMVDNLLHFRLGCGYNVWMQIIRTSVLGEWDMADVGKTVKVFAVLLMVLGALLALIALYALMKVFVVDGIRKRSDVSVCILFAIGYAVNMICYLLFAYRYPQECSMNFRYIEINIVFPAIALGLWLQESRVIWMKKAVVLTSTAFAACSVIMIGFWLFA